jgi:hypothetical protein
VELEEVMTRSADYTDAQKVTSYEKLQAGAFGAAHSGKPPAFRRDIPLFHHPEAPPRADSTLSPLNLIEIHQQRLVLEGIAGPTSVAGPPVILRSGRQAGTDRIVMRVMNSLHQHFLSQ